MAKNGFSAEDFFLLIDWTRWLINYFWLETRASFWLPILQFPNHLALEMWAKRFCVQVAKTLAKVTKNWRSLPLPWVTSQKLQVTLGDLGVTIFVNTFITVTWSHGWTRKPPQLHPPSLLPLSTCHWEGFSVLKGG